LGQVKTTAASDVGAAYNSAGQVTGTTFQLGQSSESNSYTYDADGQLLSSSGASDDTYGYDPNGNRDTTGYTVGTGNELLNSPGVTYTYDNDGNMLTATTSSGTTTYTYDYQNQLTNVEANGVMVATYTYNALGQRIGIKDNGTQTWTVYNGNSADANPYADFSSSGSLQTRYLDGLAVDQIYGQTSSSGSTEWYLTDQLGSVVAIASTSAVLDQVTYDPFGNIVTQTNATDAVRFGFAGMEFDSVTGLYYDHARYYDPEIGRFISQDPKGFAAGDTNLYRYVNNSPAAAADVDGMDWLDSYAGWFPDLGVTQWLGDTGIGDMLYAANQAAVNEANEHPPLPIFDPVFGSIAIVDKILETQFGYDLVNDSILAVGPLSVSQPSAPVGRLGNPLSGVSGNPPTTIGGRAYSGHAIDQMQARGIPPSAVENTIQTGTPSAGNSPGTVVMSDPINSLRAVINEVGKVITVITGSN
jgi:RHS repeat-associated protein